MASKSAVATAPDGNGGVYAALRENGCIADMRRRGVKHVHAYCVDNALVRPGDPTFVGFCAEKGAEAGAKVIAKAYPEEPVGVFTTRGGKVPPREITRAARARVGILRIERTRGHLCARSRQTHAEWTLRSRRATPAAARGK